MVILANTRACRCNLTHSWKGSGKPNTITAKQSGQHHQQGSQGAEQQCLAPIPSCESSDPTPLSQNLSAFKTGDPSKTAVPLTHPYTVTLQYPQQIAIAVQKATGPYSTRTEGGLRTDRWTLLHRPHLQSPRVVTHGKFTDNIFSLNGTIYTGDVCIKGWNASYSCPAQKQVESCFSKTVQSFDTDCYNHKDSSKSLNRKFLLEQ